MSQLTYKLRDLDQSQSKLGSNEDCREFRVDLAEAGKDFDAQFATLRGRCDEFGEMSVAYKEEGVQKDKHDAFINSLDQMARKLKDLKKQIEDKSRLYHELGSRRAPSMTGSRSDIQNGQRQYQQKQELEAVDKEQI